MPKKLKMGGGRGEKVQLSLAGIFLGTPRGAGWGPALEIPYSAAVTNAWPGAGRVPQQLQKVEGGQDAPLQRCHQVEGHAAGGGLGRGRAL